MEVKGGVAVFGVVEGVAFVDEDEQFLGHFVVTRCSSCRLSELDKISQNLAADRPFLDDVMSDLSRDRIQHTAYSIKG